MYCTVHIYLSRVLPEAVRNKLLEWMQPLLQTQGLSKKTQHELDLLKKRWMSYLAECMEKRMLLTIVDIYKKTIDGNRLIDGINFDLNQGILYAKKKLQAFLSLKGKDKHHSTIQMIPIKQKLQRPRMRSPSDLKEGRT